MKIVPCAFQLPNGEMLTVRSLCADDAEALNAFRLATYRVIQRMERVWKQCKRGWQALKPAR